jgi:hypothetical protein
VYRGVNVYALYSIGEVAQNPINHACHRLKNAHPLGAIFSQVLYQLSYLGSLRWIVLVALDGVKKEGVGVVMSLCPTPLCIEMILIQMEI